MSKLPLEGIRVVEFTLRYQGPYATMLLAHMGAEVIRIESSTAPQPIARDTAGFQRNNASKKSLALNVKDPRGLEVARAVVKISDIFIENYATGVMERLGMGYEDLRKVKPDIIMLSSTGLGRSGPLKDAIATFQHIQGFAGQSHLAGYKDGWPGTVAGMWADPLASMLNVTAALAALHHRQETGEGQYIRVSMAENLMAAMPEAILDFAMNGRDDGPRENQDASLSPHGAYRSQGFDKWVAIAVTNEEEWNAFCRATGHPEWAKDERFADPLSRWYNHEELDKLVTQWTLERTDYETMYILQAAGVSAGPTLDAAGLVGDPHLNDRGFFVPVGEVDGKPYTHVAHPWRSSGVEQPSYAQIPPMGEDNSYVLEELLGMSAAEITRLVEDEVLT
jgi:benzylsuccinate CoA-transferase BbsF subunit